jgi:uncharacterized membrane protein YgdD (TMEM256/DUF423 family)
MRQFLLIAAGLNGLAATAIGAVAQHLWAGDPGARMLVETGVRYALPHAAVLVALAAFPVPSTDKARRLHGAAAISLAVGTTLFSGGVFALAAGAGAAVAEIVPAGGSLMILGWVLLLALALALVRRP